LTDTRHSAIPIKLSKPTRLNPVKDNVGLTRETIHHPHQSKPPKCNEGKRDSSHDLASNKISFLAEVDKLFKSSADIAALDTTLWRAADSCSCVSNLIHGSALLVEIDLTAPLIAKCLKTRSNTLRIPNKGLVLAGTMILGRRSSSRCWQLHLLDGKTLGKLWKSNLGVRLQKINLMLNIQRRMRKVKAFWKLEDLHLDGTNVGHLVGTQSGKRDYSSEDGGNENGSEEGDVHYCRDDEGI
jgi:hypothetical protein